MIASNRRCRIVSFRLSPEEYEALRVFSANNGIQSISELARRAIEDYLSSNAMRPSDLESKIEWLAGRLSVLDRAVERLAQLVESKAAAGESQPPRQSA
jgi:hypothetical protein